MLHAKFQDHRTSGSGEGRFLKVFIIYGHGGHLGYVTWTIYIYFRSPFPRRLHIKSGFDWPSGLEEKTFEIVDGLQRQTTPDNGYPISSPMSLWLR